MRTLTLTPAWIEGLRQEVLRILRTVESASTYAEATSIRQYLAAWVPAFEDRMMHLADAAQRVLAPGDRFDAEPVRAVRTLARDLAHRLLYEFDERPMGHHLAPDDFERWTFATWLRTRDATVRRLRELAQRLWRALREAHDAAAHRGATLTLTAEEPRPYRLAGFDVALVGDAQVPGAGDFVRRFERLLRVLRERLDRVMPGAAALFCPIVLVWGAGYDARLMGQYFPASEVIEMYPEGLEGVRDDGVVAAVAHEGGHHLWRRVLDSAARAEWAAFVEQSLVTLDLATLRAAWETAQAMVGEPLSLLEVAQVLRAHDPRLALQVESLLNVPDAPWRPDVTLAELDAAASRTSPKVLRDPITAYARKNAQDAFCEALALLVGYGGHTLPGDVRQWLRVVVPALRTERANDLDAAERWNGARKTLVTLDPRDADGSKSNHAGAAGVCSCGADKPHVIASRRTADGTQVEVWDDGAVTGGYGMALPGVPVVRPRTDDARREALAAAWMLAGDVALYDLAEVPALYATARKVAQAGGGVAEFHAALRDAQETPARAPALRLQWQTYETDATGRPTVRVAILDRMRWPGLAVWHERGRYLLMNVEYIANQRRSEPVLVPTGFTFRSQQELATHLYTHQKQAGILRTKDNSAVAKRDFWRHRTVTRTNRWGEEEETREGYSEIEPAYLTADHWQDPAVIAAKDVANRTRNWSFVLRPAASDDESSLIGQSRQVGQGNFGIVYRVDTLDGPRRVKIPAPYNVHQKTWTWEEQRANLLHDVGVSNEVRALGFDVVPVQVYTEFGGTPALVGEWGEPVTELSGAEYGALEEALVAIEREHGWRVRDDLQVYRRPDGSVYVGDVGFWGAPDPQQKWTHQTTALPQLLDKLQQQTLAGLTVDPERLKGIQPGYEWTARRSVHNLPELLWRANVLADLRAESEEDGPARSKHPAMLQWNARDAQSFLDALDDRDRLGIPTPAAVRDAGTADARAVLAVTGPYVPRERTKENGRRHAEAVREALESARHAAILRRTEEPVTSLPRNLPSRCPVHFNHPHGWIYPGGWCPVCFPERTA